MYTYEEHSKPKILVVYERFNNGVYLHAKTYGIVCYPSLND